MKKFKYTLSIIIFLIISIFIFKDKYSNIILNDNVEIVVEDSLDKINNINVLNANKVLSDNLLEYNSSTKIIKEDKIVLDDENRIILETDEGNISFLITNINSMNGITEKEFEKYSKFNQINFEEIDLDKIMNNNIDLWE